MNRIALSAGLILVISCGAPAANAKLSEKDLTHYKSAVLSRVIDDNPEREDGHPHLFQRHGAGG